MLTLLLSLPALPPGSQAALSSAQQRKILSDYEAQQDKLARDKRKQNV